MKIIKYIVVRVGVLNDFEKVAVIFPDTVQHSHLAKVMGVSVEKGDVLAAGFAKTEVVEGKVVVEVYGKSFSLGIGSREEDLELVKQTLAV